MYGETRPIISNVVITVPFLGNLKEGCKNIVNDLMCNVVTLIMRCAKWGMAAFLKMFN